MTIKQTLQKIALGASLFAAGAGISIPLAYNAGVRDIPQASAYSEGYKTGLTNTKNILNRAYTSEFNYAEKCFANKNYEGQKEAHHTLGTLRCLTDSIDSEALK